MKYYTIGSLGVSIAPGPIEIQDDMLTAAFVSEAEKTDCRFRIECRETDLSFLKEWEIELYTGAYEIRKGQGRRFLLHHWMTYRFAYGVYLDELYGNGPVTVYCNGAIGEQIKLRTSTLLGAGGLHHRLLQEGCGVLHASYISHKGRGILFAAPSQTGKSTQAELWRQYAGAEILNGDRALLFSHNGRWYTGGYTACGSSEICRNESYPLCAIVFLEQGKDNLIRLATVKERIHSLLTGMETFHWSMEDMDLALKFVARIGADVPILHYRCRPDEDAVHTLENYLEEMCQC